MCKAKYIFFIWEKYNRILHPISCLILLPFKNHCFCQTNPLQIVPFELPHFLQLGLFNYFGESLIAKINILLDCLFYVTQEKVSHWFCYWWFHQKCDTFSWNFSNVIRCYLFDRRMPNLVMVPIRHCLPLFCLWWDYRLKKNVLSNFAFQ